MSVIDKLFEEAKKPSTTAKKTTYTLKDALKPMPLTAKEKEKPKAEKVTSPRFIPSQVQPVSDPLNIRPSLPQTIRTIPTPPTMPVEQPFSSKYATQSGKSPLLEKYKADEIEKFNSTVIKKQQDKEEQKRLASAKEKLSLVEAEIKRLQKEQGLFGTKNASKIATLFNQSEGLKLEANPKITRFIQSGTSGLYGNVASMKPEKVGGTSQAFETVGSLPGYKGSDIGGQIAQQVASYMGAGAVIKAVPTIANAAGVFGKFGTNVISKIPGGASFVSKIGAEETAKFVGQQGVDFLIDRIVQEPQAVFKAIKEDETLGDYAKGLLERSALDIAFNLAIGIGGEKISQAVRDRARRSLASQGGIEQMRRVGVDPDDVLKSLDGDADSIKRVQEKIGHGNKPKIEQPVIGDVYVNPQGTASKSLAQAEMPLSMPDTKLALPPPSKELDAYTQWRRDNFGGASGKLSEADDIAMKQLYKEDTGIDLLTPTREVPRTITPNELAEQRLIDLGRRVKSGEVSQAEAEMVAKQLTDELQAPKPVEAPDMSTLEGRLKAFAQENEVARVDMPVDKPTTINVPLKSKKAKPLKPIPDVPTTKTEPELAKDFRSKVSRDTKGTKEPFFVRFKKNLEKAKSQTVDDFASFERVEKDILGYTPSAEKSFYKKARATKGATEKANLILENKLAPIVDKVITSGKTQADLGDYALAVHAKDVNKAGLNSGFTNAEIDATIKQLYTPEIEAARKELVKLSNELIDDLVDSGRIEAKQAKAMRDKWANYMPLFRSFDDEKVDIAFGLSKAFSNVSNPIKNLKGSSKNVIDPLESMVKNIYKITDTSAKNRVGVQFHELAQLDKANNFIRKLADDELVGRKNVVGVFVDGKKINYEVDPEVFKAFNNLDEVSSGILVKLLAKPASILRAGATLAPDFAASNPIRDIWSAFTLSKSGFNPIVDFPAGLASVMKKDKLYEGFVNNLGAYGGIAAIDRQAYRKTLQNALKQPVSKKIVNIVNPKSWIKLLQTISSTTEQATKVGEYRAALRSGATPEEAAFRARDLMDFARGGSSTRQINKVVAFFNGNIQGKSKLIRAIKEDPVGVLTRMTVSMVLPTIGVATWNDKVANEEQKATIKDSQGWERSVFWLIAIPGTDMVARIPKPFDIAVVSNVTERFLDYAKENDPDAFDGLVKETLKNSSIPVMLTGITPIIEGATNYSFFRQGKIIPQSEEGRNKKDQYDMRTSEVAKGLSKVTSAIAPNSNFASPRILDYTLRSSTGGLGSYALDATDFLIRKVSKDDTVRPSKSFEQLPIAKRFLMNPLTSGKSTNEVYDFKDKLSREKESAKFKFDSKYGKPKEGKKRPILFETEYFPKEKQKLLDKATDMTDAMSDFSKLIKSVETSKTMSANQKRDEIEKLVKQRNDFARKSIAELKALD